MCIKDIKNAFESCSSAYVDKKWSKRTVKFQKLTRVCNVHNVLFSKLICCTCTISNSLSQGLLYTWTGRPWQKFENLKLIEVSKSYQNHTYILKSYRLLQSLRALAQKMSPPGPFKFWTSQGHTSLNFWVTPSKFWSNVYFL